MLNESAASEEHVVFQSVCLCVVFRNTTITTVFIISIIVYIYCKQFKVVGNLYFMVVVLLMSVCVCACVCSSKLRPHFRKLCCLPVTEDVC